MAQRGICCLRPPDPSPTRRGERPGGGGGGGGGGDCWLMVTGYGWMAGNGHRPARYAPVRPAALASTLRSDALG